MLKSNGPVFEMPLGEIRLYDCPYCATQWFELVDSDEYPEYCPHCGWGPFEEDDT